LKKQQITVRVPATTSNLGPGFDCLGVALRLYNFVTVSRASEIEAGAMARQAARQFFQAADCEPFAFFCAVQGEVPRSRGLGSSVTVRLGVLHALNAFSIVRSNALRFLGSAPSLKDTLTMRLPAEFGGFVVGAP
jgi:homoserine kinase